MTLGFSIFLMAVGAVLRFAVTQQEVAGINIWAVGVILMIVGLAGLLFGLALLTMRRRTDVIVDDPTPVGYARTPVVADDQIDYVQPATRRVAGRRRTTYVEPPLEPML